MNPKIVNYPIKKKMTFNVQKKKKNYIFIKRYINPT